MASAYAALVSLSHIIHQILHPPPTHHFLIPRKQIESLQEQVGSLIDFLEKYSTQETEDLEKRIVGAAYEAEDIIESDVLNQIQAKYEIRQGINDSSFSLPKEIRKLLPIQKLLKKITILKVIKKLISIRKEADKIRNRRGVDDLGRANSMGASSSRSAVPGGKNVMIGFDEHLNEIRTVLATYESGLRITPVVGMGGIGKTTLATHVYNDAYIIERFEFRAWVSVSLECNEREIVVALLQQINCNILVNGLSAAEIGNLVHKELFGRRYFIVLDDMWDIEAWDRLKLFLPDNNSGSRILVTTRLLNLVVGFESCTPYQLNLLNSDSSWALLLERVFGKEDCPNELEENGKSIARKCGGLPLALVVIGGLLAKSDKTRVFWEYVDENVTSTANDENDEQCMKILRLSYSQLPVYLKPCFLYLATFPKNVEIRKSRFIKLLVAEGLIKPVSGRTLEDVGEGYLEDLFDRNLVMVKKRGLTGKVKTCSLHDLLRDLCLREVEKDKFMSCIGELDSPNISPHMKSERRLSIHIDAANEKALEVLSESRKCVARRLSLLRILDAVDFYSIEEILRLFNSRYISCSILGMFHAMPSLIFLLWNLQTLVVPGPVSRPVFLRFEIWKMPQLRHLKLPGIYLPDPPDGQGETRDIIVLENLQTLSTVNNFILSEQVLTRIPNIKKLGIRCGGIGLSSLSNLATLKILESLTLSYIGIWENMAFPSSLKKLSLSDCQIAWEDMSTVGSLPNLEVLKLQTRAAKGRVWNPNADEFCRLKFLLIDQCQMETWVADDCHFPCLEHLHLVNMKMEEIPIEFAEIPTLQSIDLTYCSRSLTASAKRISEEREAFGYEEVRVRSFSFEGLGLNKDNVVGFEDEAARLIGYLTNESEQLEVISIIGMSGIGKTTLAKMIFHDPGIQYKFRLRIWVYVSQEFTRKDIFLSILREVMSVSEDVKYKTDTELASLVDDFLKWRTFLLVMDDLRSREDWDALKIALPMSNRWGKVLITSRQEEVGRHVNCCRGPHMLRFLTPEEGNLLLWREVFGRPEYPQELEAEGRVIAERCNGLPLAILLIAGILGEMSSTKEAWEEVSDILFTYLDYDPVARMERIISLSYGKLPHHMRKCFLYMGMFPQGFEIPAWRLIWLWIAEGLIQQQNDDDDDMSMEETAENYLEGLISRNVVRVDKLKVDGKVKTCRVHDLLWDYCKTEAERDNFFQEIKISRDGGFQFPVSKELEYHRLCIRSSVLKFISQKPFGGAQSVVYFARDETTTLLYDLSGIPGRENHFVLFVDERTIFKGFKQLRVLDACPIKFTELPSGMFQSLHLTYIAISGNFHVLPAFFSECWNLQTLIVDTTSQILVVKVDILNMVQLKHFKSNASASLPEKDRSHGDDKMQTPLPEMDTKIQTLGMILPESCYEKAFDRARNLKKLAICGKLLFRSFDSFGNLGKLEKLKLKYDAPHPPSEGILRALPPAYKFPSKLTSLTLSNTYLRWHYMSVLGSLKNLEVLKLKDKAFMGTYWTETGAVFPNLQVLHIGRTDLQIWLASHDQFPRLKCLQLRNCENLKEIPFCLADIPSLQILGLYNCYGIAVESATKIAKKKQEGQQSGNAHEFSLNIFPSLQLEW